MTARRVAGYAVLALFIVGALIAVARATEAPSGDPAHQVAAQLSCPDCAGQSVADSNSPVAESMRTVIAEQIAEGRTPDQVRDWFVDRYGADVVRTPPNGAGILLWAGPLVVTVAAGIAAAYTIYRRRLDTPKSNSGTASHRGTVFYSVTGVVVAMVVAVAVAGWSIERPAQTKQASPAAVSVDQPLELARSLESQGNFAAAADLYREAATARPDPAIRLRLAFALLRADRAAEALPIAEQAQAQTPRDPDALLILGLVQRAAGKPEADQTLSRFLEAAPNHPAADQVRAVLEPN